MVEITPQQVTATIAEVCGLESARRIHERAFPEVEFPEPTEGSTDGPSPLALMTAVEPSHGDSDGSSSETSNSSSDEDDGDLLHSEPDDDEEEDVVQPPSKRRKCVKLVVHKPMPEPELRKYYSMTMIKLFPDLVV
jgi:hypothetical protein